MKKRISMLVSTLALAALAGMAQAETRLAVQDNSSTPVDKFVVTDTGNIGVGTTAPSSPLHAIANPVGHAGGWTNVIKIEGNDVTNAAGFAAYRNTGALQKANARLGFIFFGDNYLRLNHPVGFFANAEEDWTSTSTPANFDFSTTPSGSVTRLVRMRISASGNMGIGTTVPTQRLEVNGGIRLNTVDTKPTCDSTKSGSLWFTNGATDDTFEVCSKKSSSYAWRAITLP